MFACRHALRVCLVGMLATIGQAFAQSSDSSEVDWLLASSEAPVGVAFEIVEDENDALGWALERVAREARRLRMRFPDLPVVVVSHGTEQFALMKRHANDDLAPIHAQARNFVEQDIPLHVCGAHAGWYGHVPEDFPDYVDVSPSGPAQLNDYESLGYTIIHLSRDD